MEEDIKYFIPIANEFYATGIGYYVIAAKVEDDKDPVYKNIDIFQRLHIVGPKEVYDEWKTLPRQYFIEVKGIREGKISLEKYIELYNKYSKTCIKEEIDTEKIQEMIDKYTAEEVEENKQTFYRLYCNGKITADDVGEYIEKWKETGSNGELYHYLGMTCHQYNIWVRHGVLIKEENTRT